MAGNFKESAFLAYQAFRELANHEMNLAASLQSLVPSNPGGSSKSAQYLQEEAVVLKDLSEQVKTLMAAYLSQPSSPPQR